MFICIFILFIWSSFCEVSQRFLSKENNIMKVMFCAEDFVSSPHRRDVAGGNLEVLTFSQERQNESVFRAAEYIE